MVLPKLSEMNPSMITAARDLGATSSQVLTRIVLPAITPGILSGFFMAFTYSLDDFAVTFFVTGMDSQRLPLKSTHVRAKGISLEINALKCIDVPILIITRDWILFHSKIPTKRLNGEGFRE